MADERDPTPGSPEGSAFDTSDLDALFAGEQGASDAVSDANAVDGHQSHPVNVPHDQASDNATASGSAGGDSSPNPAEIDAQQAQQSVAEDGRGLDLSGMASDAQSLSLTDLDDSTSSPANTKKVTMLNDVKLRVKLQLGRTKMFVEDILKLDEGSVVELDKLAGDPIDVLVNDRLVARGEVLVLNDNFCVRISEVISHDPHRITT